MAATVWNEISLACISSLESNFGSWIYEFPSRNRCCRYNAFYIHLHPSLGVYMYLNILLQRDHWYCEWWGCWTCLPMASGHLLQSRLRMLQQFQDATLGRLQGPFVWWYNHLPQIHCNISTLHWKLQGQGTESRFTSKCSTCPCWGTQGLFKRR